MKEIYDWEIYDWVPWFHELAGKIAEKGTQYLIEKSREVEWEKTVVIYINLGQYQSHIDKVKKTFSGCGTILIWDSEQYIRRIRLSMDPRELAKPTRQGN